MSQPPQKRKPGREKMVTRALVMVHEIKGLVVKHW